MRTALALSVIAFLCVVTAQAQTIANQAYANETADWNVAPTYAIRTSQYHAPTPTSIPSGRIIYTFWLNQALQGPNRPLLVNVLDGNTVRALPGSVWFSRGGHGTALTDPNQQRFESRLAALTGGNKAAPVVFYCLSSECWLSYNATLRALQAGYSNAMWYRGGVEAWQAAGLPTTVMQTDQW